MKYVIAICRTAILTLLPLLLLEIFMRIHTGYPTGYNLGKDVAEVRNGVFVYKQSPDIVMYPVLFGGYHIHPNNYGFRPTSPHQFISEQKRPHTQRIFCVGDSWTDSADVDDDATYPWQLQEALDQRDPGTYEVINTSYFGASITKSFNRLKAFLNLQPDVVILDFCPSSLGKELEWDDIKQDPRKINPLRLRHGKMSWLESYFYSYTALGEWTARRRNNQAIERRIRERDRNASWQQKMAILHSDLATFHDLTYGTALPPYFQERFQVYFRILDEFNAFCRQHGIKLILWTTPEFDEVYDRSCPRTYLSVLRSHCQQRGIPIYDFIPAFQKAINSNPKLNYYDLAPVDFHPGRNGYHIIAEQLAGILQPMQMTPRNSSKTTVPSEN